MRIDYLLGGLLAALALNSLHAQENKTAVTPVENIKLNGVTVPLNIKTLAEIQRLQEEQDMRKELQAALKNGASVTKSTANKPQASTSAKVTANKLAATPVRITGKPVPAISANTLLGVYGTTGKMTAEIQTTDKRVQTLREGEQFGKFNIKRITQNGLELITNNGNTQHVSVGSQVRF